jgi:hypothetical protein
MLREVSFGFTDEFAVSRLYRGARYGTPRYQVYARELVLREEFPSP